MRVGYSLSFSADMWKLGPQKVKWNLHIAMKPYLEMLNLEFESRK